MFDVFQSAIINAIESKKVTPPSRSLASSRLEAEKQTEEKKTDQDFPGAESAVHCETSATVNEKDTPAPQGKLILGSSLLIRCL